MSKRFTRFPEIWTKSEQTENKKVDHLAVLMVIGISLMVVALSRFVAQKMPTVAFINASVWEYIFVSIIGLTLGVTKLGKLNGADLVSNVMLTLVMTLLATELNILQIADAWLYIVAGAVVLIVHGALYVLLAKLFRLDLHSCGTASIANVGAIPPRPLLRQLTIVLMFPFPSSCPQWLRGRYVYWSAALSVVAAL